MIQLDAQTGSGMPGFLKGWGSLIVAAVALLQPWAIALWRRFFRPGTIDIHETGTIEVGYSGFGPTIGLRGTLRAVHRDQFVRDIQLAVAKLKDGSKHSFEWVLFRAEKLTATGNDRTTVEIASGFMLVTSRPQRYSLLFADNVTLGEMKPHMERVSAEWATFTRKAASVAAQGGTAGSPMSIRRAIMRSPSVYVDFSKTKVHVDAYGVLERRMYWEPGKYLLEMRVNTARPESTFTRRWTFDLTDADFQNLCLNATAILRQTCERTNVTYNFAYPKYEND